MNPWIVRAQFLPARRRLETNLLESQLLGKLGRQLGEPEVLGQERSGKIVFRRGLEFLSFSRDFGEQEVRIEVDATSRLRHCACAGSQPCGTEQ